MNLRLQRVQRILRDSGLLGPIEKFRYLLSVVRWYRKNREFIQKHPDFKVPPKVLAYDAYSAPDWDFYKQSGEETAVFLAAISNKYLSHDIPLQVLEWGCGPGRVIRHIPNAFSGNTNTYGSDYNPATIAWCNDNIGQIKFSLNGLQPPLHFEGGYFDLIYSISVITHLSEEVSRLWVDELLRLVRPGGILVITTNGDSRKNVMRPDEIEAYESIGLVIRGKFEEGKKMYWACHSPQYLREKLFSGFEVLEHVNAGFPYTGQDYWVLRKPR
ncbi:MAG: class I SAM-dependent methyltransferase [Gammaproteobacteria bacterium]|nr:class I SAM-dependent methyltransferase [Gammaproteobacteria bacterium]